MSASWRLFIAALHFVSRGPVLPRAAIRLVPLAGIVVAAAGAAVYWLGAQLWPTSIAVVLATWKYV
jgi:cobalamin synthase